MPQALPRISDLSQGASLSRTHNTRETRFEDGYSQRMPAGINSAIWSGSLSYEGMNNAARDEILTAFDAVGGWDYLLFDPLNEDQSNPLRFRLTKGYRITLLSGSLCSISFDLEQDF